MLARLPLDVCAMVVAYTGITAVKSLLAAGAPLDAPALARRYACIQVGGNIPELNCEDATVARAVQTIDWFCRYSGNEREWNFPDNIQSAVLRRCILYDPESLTRCRFIDASVIRYLLDVVDDDDDDWFIGSVCCPLLKDANVWTLLVSELDRRARPLERVLCLCVGLVRHMLPPWQTHVEWFAARSSALGMLVSAAYYVYTCDKPNTHVDEGVSALRLLEAVNVTVPKTPDELRDVATTLRYVEDHELDEQQRAIQEYYNAQAAAAASPPAAKQPCLVAAAANDDAAEQPLPRLDFVLFPRAKTWLSGWFSTDNVAFDSRAIRFENLPTPRHSANRVLLAIGIDETVHTLCDAPREVVEQMRTAFVSGVTIDGATPQIVILEPLMALVMVGARGVESVTFF